MEEPIIWILLFPSYLRILYGYCKFPQLEGPILDTDKKYELFQHASGAKISNILKINENQCIVVSEFSTLETFLSTSVSDSFFIENW